MKVIKIENARIKNKEVCFNEYYGAFPVFLCFIIPQGSFFCIQSEFIKKLNGLNFCSKLRRKKNVW